MDVYSHILPGMEQDAVASLDEIVPVVESGASANSVNLAPLRDMR